MLCTYVNDSAYQMLYVRARILTKVASEVPPDLAADLWGVLCFDVAPVASLGMGAR